MKHYAIIVAGGAGMRMQTEIPKQFILLGGKPVLMHTIQRFFEADATIEIIVVLPAVEINTWKKLTNQFTFSIRHTLIPGGETRFQSVKNGLQEVTQKSVVAIHDGVRPFVSTALIMNCFAEAEKNGSAVPVIAIRESIRKLDGGESKIADRSDFVFVQTPQCFDSTLLNHAYEVGYQKNFTDDASVVEFSGEKIHLVNGEYENMKITYPVDLLTAETIFNMNTKDKR